MNLLDSSPSIYFFTLLIFLSCTETSLKAKSQEILDEEAEQLYNSVKKIIENTKPGDRLPVHVMKKLQEAGENNHEKSLEILASSFLFTELVSQSLPLSKRYYELLAEKGNSVGQFGLFFFNTHGFGVQQKNLSSALTNLKFSALQGETFAEIAMAYRYYFGINMEASCENALTYYSRAAKKVYYSLHQKVKKFGYLAAGGSGIHRIRLQEEVSNSGIGMTNPSNVLIDEEFLNYMKFMADKNNVSAQISLGQLYYQGSHGVAEDHDKAFYHFKSAYSSGNILAGAYLGEIYMHGTSSNGKDELLGLQYLKEAAEKMNPIAQTGLGLAYLYGKANLDKNALKAFEFINKAADQGWPDAQFYMGLIFLGEIDNEYFQDKIDYRIALRYLSLASQQGNILAIYYLALMHSSGIGVLRSCQTSTLLFKNVAERGTWSHYFNSAHALYNSGSIDLAFSQYLLLAEMGYEVAASNVAFLLEEGRVNIVPKENHLSMALIYWHRSANQDNSESRIKIGDYYYFGMGTAVDYELAVHHYRIASDILHNSQAMFNLGYMHENGLGFKRDLHLAKRYYDLAFETSTEAIIPVKLALGKLYVNQYIDNLKDILQKHKYGKIIVQDIEMLFLSVLILILSSLFLAKFYLANQNNQQRQNSSIPESSE